MQLNDLGLTIAAGLASLVFSSFEMNGQQATNLDGAWHLKNGTDEQLLLFTDGYFTHTS